MSAGAYVERGNALHRAGDLAGAMASYKAALDCEPEDFKANYSLGVALQELYRHAEARRYYERALNAAPGDARTRANLSIVKLMEGDFASAWDDYESRLASGAVELRPVALPRFERVDLGRARRVAVRREQGIGDQVLFSTLLPELAASGTAAVVETDRRLVPAYRRSVPGLEFVSKAKAPEAFAACDSEIPIGSLPRLFRRHASDFSRQPRRVLVADPLRKAALAPHFGAGPHIAISWRTFQPAGRGHVESPRTIPLERFSVLEATLVDLQYGDVSEERRAFDARHPGVRLDLPSLDRFEDLENVMAAIELCDLVVTPSNITAHLAGALGKRTWLVYLAGNAPFHYWVSGPDGRSLWYPAIEIMTDRSWTTWEEAFAAVAERWKRER